MKIIATISDPEVVRKNVTSLGLPTRGPPVAPAKERHQRDVELEAWRWATVGRLGRVACAPSRGCKPRSGPDRVAAPATYPAEHHCGGAPTSGIAALRRLPAEVVRR